MMFEYALVLSSYLFSMGIYGLIISRNMVRALMCLELILNADLAGLLTKPNVHAYVVSKGIRGSY
ncbi:hypothetical protein AMTRI_Chr02g219040 [Amborella trichopoda]